MVKIMPRELTRLLFLFRLYKILIIGPPKSGKTSITTRYLGSPFVDESLSTISVDFHTTTINLQSEPSTRVKLNIFDYPGQETFGKSAPEWIFRSVNGIIIVFDLTHRESFEDLPRYILDAKTRFPSNHVTFLVGNKSDEVEHRVISAEEVNRFAAKNALKYYETSAKHLIRVSESFDDMADACRAASQGTFGT
jgi:small GTP-binding protein